MRILESLSIAALALTFSACGGGEKDDTGVTDTNSSDTSTDTAPDTSTPDGTTSLTFNLTGDYAGASITLTQVTPGDDSFSFGESPLLSAAADSDLVTVSLPEPDEGDLVEIDEFPGLSIAMYLPALHDGEVYIGMTDRWPAYVVGKVPKKLSTVGLTEGWNTLTFSFENEDEALTIEELSNITLDTNLLPVDSISMGGTYAGDFDVDDLRIAAMSFAEFEGEVITDRVVDQAMSDPWTVEITEAPGAEHFMTDKKSGMTFAGEMLVSYIDNDGDSSFSLSADTVDGQACTADGEVVGLMYFPGFDDLDMALFSLISGLQTGWNAVTIGGDKGDEKGGMPTLDAAALSTLVLGGECSF